MPVSRLAGCEGRFLPLACFAVAAPPNNGMHPTADTPALIFGYILGRRVMPALDCCCAIALC
jgi:hypothetical protein